MNKIKQVIQKEVEIKANVVDIKSLIDFLYKNTKYKKKFFKKDIYYAKNVNIKLMNVPIDECLRLRVENGKYTFCTKIRDLIEGVEVNTEREMVFGKKRTRDILRFLANILDYGEYVKKEKKGRAFLYKETLIEVSSIKGLGDFVEIEMIDSKLDINNQIMHIKNILSEMEIKESDIEIIPYITLLANKL